MAIFLAIPIILLLSVHVLAAVPHHNAAIVPTMQPLDPEAMKLIFSKQR